MNVYESRDSDDGGLRVKLVEHDRRTGRGRIQIIPLHQERAGYDVTVRYSSGQRAPG
jgi:hypothetical protein